MSNSPENIYTLKPTQYHDITNILFKLYNSVPYININSYKFCIFAYGSYLNTIYNILYKQHYNVLIVDQIVENGEYISLFINTSIHNNYIVSNIKILIRFGTGKLEIMDILKCLSILNPIIYGFSDLY